MASSNVINTLIADPRGEGEPGMLAVAWASKQRRAGSDDPGRDGAHRFSGHDNPGAGAIEGWQRHSVANRDR